MYGSWRSETCRPRPEVSVHAQGASAVGWLWLSAIAEAGSEVTPPRRSAGRSSSACRLYPPGWPGPRPAWRRGGCRCAEVVRGWPGRATTSRPPGLMRTGGVGAGRPVAGSLLLTGRRTSPGAMRRSAGIRSRAGWRSSSPPRWPTWRTVRYDISWDPRKDRWYLDASWTFPPQSQAGLDGLRQHPVLAVDLNVGHLAAWVIDQSGNPCGPPLTIPLGLEGLPSSTRDGHLRQAIS